MEVEIPFNKWSKEKLRLKRKFCTSRSKIYGEEKDYFFVDGVKYIIKRIIRLPLWFVRDFLWYLEGADSKEEFVEVWKSIYRGRFDENKEVYTHFFL